MLACLKLTCCPAGEYGDQIFDSQLLPGEEPVSATPKDLVQLLCSVLAKPNLDPISVEYVLTALMKLASRLPDQSDTIKVTYRPISCHVP